MMQRRETIIWIASCFILFLGFGRMLSLVLHDPLIGYANNYEMIALQACHQIWPADTGVDITRGTPAAPLRDYTLDKHVETPCFPSSELVFTSAGIQLAKLINRLTSHSTISLQIIGVTKAAFLIIAALAIHLVCWKQHQYTGMTINALTVFLVLSDPGITLYFNTFYSEFSVVYFLYLLLAGAALAWNSERSWPGVVLLLAGIVGFDFAKVQHFPLLLAMSAVLAYGIGRYQKRFILAALIVASLCLPVLLQHLDYFKPQNANMVLAGKVNTMGSALSATRNMRSLLADLALPDSCQALAGKNWYAPAIQQNKICFELKDVHRLKIDYVLMSHPATVLALIQRGAPNIKEWIVRHYGHVESERMGNVNAYFWSITDLLRSLSDTVFLLLLFIPAIITSMALVISRLKKHALNRAWYTGCFLAWLPIATYLETLFGNGLVDLSKNAHLVVPTLLILYIALISHVMLRFILTQQEPGQA